MLRLPFAAGGVFAGALLTCASAQSRYFWSRSYAGPAQGSDIASSVALGAQGQVFVAGYTRGANDLDALVLAYDPFGQLLWQRSIDLGQNESLGAIACDPASGALYVAGASTSTVASVPALLLARLDPATGTSLWQQAYSGPAQQGAAALALALDATGAPVVGGYLGTGSVHDVLLARFDATGALSWSYATPTPGTSTGYVSRITLAPGGDLLTQFAEYLPGSGTQHTFVRFSAAGVPLWSRNVGATDLGCFGPLVDAAGNVAYAINVSLPGGHVFAKLDASGNPLWTIDSAPYFGVNGSIYGLVQDAQGELTSTGTNGALVHVDANGNLLWTHGMPAAQWFDTGTPLGLALAPNGDIVQRLQGHTPLELTDYDAIARFDAAGHFLWSQSVRDAEPNIDVHAYAILPAPQGSVILAGQRQPASASSPDVFVAALHVQSHAFCFGDGSSGPCPCGNDAPSGAPSGCRRGGSTVGARLDDQGIASIASDSLRFYGTGVPSNGLCMLLQGHPAPNAQVLQDGLLCLTGVVTRLQGANATSFTFDLPPAGAQRLSARSALLGDPIAPGTPRAYQVYYRGGPGACAASNGNLTNGVVVDWLP